MRLQIGLEEGDDHVGDGILRGCVVDDRVQRRWRHFRPGETRLLPALALAAAFQRLVGGSGVGSVVGSEEEGRRASSPRFLLLSRFLPRFLATDADSASEIDAAEERVDDDAAAAATAAAASPPATAAANRRRSGRADFSDVRIGVR